MELLKKYIVVVISAVVSVAALVGVAVGISRFSGLQKELDQAKGLVTNLQTIEKGVPVPTADGVVQLIATEELVTTFRQVAVEGAAQSREALAESLYENIGYDPETGTIKRALVMEGIFPEPISTSLPYGFRSAYEQALLDLLSAMDAGGVPRESEIRKELDNLELTTGFHSDKDSASERRTETTAAATDSGLQLTEQDKQLLAVQRAAEVRAGAIKIYADWSCLDVVKEVFATDQGTAPWLRDMWWAQMSLWIQQDIVRAIAEVNGSAKDVTGSAVKRLHGIEVAHGYYLGPVGGSAMAGTGNLPQSFTGISPNGDWDVTGFKLEVTVDVRRLPELIAAISRQGHYVLYSWDLEAVQKPQQDRQGNRSVGRTIDESLLYRYGTDPLVRFVGCWEAYQIKDFHHWGIVGYGVDAQKNPTVKLYDGKVVAVPAEGGREDVAGLTGLMPKEIREALSLEEQPSSSGQSPRRGRGR
ncbi:MAG: hypothetical protein GXY33_18425 [Phycisphaerae bacterium]|nr:hypothetical protein [Phycisphaerae bacterium]